MNLFRRLFGRKPEAAAPVAALAATPPRADVPVAAPAKRVQRIRPDVVERMRSRKEIAAINPFAVAQGLHPPKVDIPSSGMAADSAVASASAWAGGYAGVGLSGIAFRGFPVLAELSQRPEYSKVSQFYASEMTRAWIELQVSGTDEDKSDKIRAINDEMDRLRVRDVFRQAAEHDGLYGRAHIYIDLGNDDPSELSTNIGDGADDASREKVGKGALKRLATVEPVWVYPSGYDTANPLSPYFYQPRAWQVMGSRSVHPSRLLTIVGRPVSELLKAAYSFAGRSRTQDIESAVENYLKIRQDVADLIESFNTYVLSTDMTSILTAGSDDVLAARIAVFTGAKDNFGVLAIDKDAETFQNISAQLGSLDKLLAQSLEQICAVAKIPLMKYTGISPSGLNASSEGEIRSSADDIAADQERIFRRPLTTIIDLIQLSLFGEVDKSITFRFVHLWSLSEKEQADIQEVRARTDASLIAAGVIRKGESRRRVSSDAGAPYNGLDADDLPPLTIDEGTKLAAAKIAAGEAGLLGDRPILQGLSDTGLYPEITAEMIAQADADPPAPTELGEGGEGLGAEAEAGTLGADPSPSLFDQHRTTDPVPDPLGQIEREGRLKLGNEGNDDG